VTLACAGFRPAVVHRLGNVCTEVHVSVSILLRASSTAGETDALTKLVNLWPASRIDELMPWAYAKGTAVKTRP
jgi:hypothetical protein